MFALGSINQSHVKVKVSALVLGLGLEGSSDRRVQMLRLVLA